MRGWRHGERDDHRAARLTVPSLPLSSAALAISAAGWAFRAVLAVVAMLVIYLVGASTLGKFKIAPDAEPDPERVVPVDARFRCIVCGAEVTMTSAQDADQLDAPRHCREDMIRVGPH